MTARIKKLEQEVVNRIAAGEVIVRPSNALKELLENSIDAGSTRIDIVCKDGGLKLLQITDNGCGVEKDDLSILCERHTTSKLSSFQDLESIATYGFRGEALSSISQIAHLSVTTKTKDSPCAYRVKYANGLMVDPPKAIAGNKGTQLTVEDLFYNYQARLSAFSDGNKEYKNVLAVAVKYAIHSQGISISCKRHGDTHPGLSVQKDWDVVDRVRSFYGSSIANELLDIKVEPDEKYGLTKGECHISNANYSAKSSLPYIIFINHRLVTCAPLQRAISQVYSAFLPKGGNPFVYLSLEINPLNVDVNIHPTKREVRFLHEDEIVELVCAAVQESLSKVDSSRAFKTQTVLPYADVSQQHRTPRPGRMMGNSGSSNSSPYAYHQVRTDHSQQKITTLLTSQLNQSESRNLESKRKYQAVRLRSIKEFRNAVVESAHKALTQVFAMHKYIGVVDFARRLASFQYGEKLYLADYGKATYELFYQIALSEFGNFGYIELETPVPLKDLLDVATMELQEESSGSTVVTKTASPELENMLSIFKKEQTLAMLEEYFSISISKNGSEEEEEEEEEGATNTMADDPELMLKTMPLLLNGYTFPVSKLPEFFYNISQADWTSEDDCLNTILKELAQLYSPESLPEDDAEYEADRSTLATQLEHIIFPAIKKRLTVPNSMESSVVELASMPGLYRVFERC